MMKNVCSNKHFLKKIWISFTDGSVNCDRRVFIQLYVVNQFGVSEENNIISFLSVSCVIAVVNLKSPS